MNGATSRRKSEKLLSFLKWQVRALRRALQPASQPASQPALSASFPARSPALAGMLWLASFGRSYRNLVCSKTEDTEI